MRLLPLLLLAVMLAGCEHPAPHPTAPVLLAPCRCSLWVLHAPTPFRPATQRRQLQTRPPLLVPAGAITTEGGLPGVFVLNHDRARFRLVRTGRTVGASTQILSGLDGQETLVLGGAQILHDGTPVLPRTPR